VPLYISGFSLSKSINEKADPLFLLERRDPEEDFEVPDFDRLDPTCSLNVFRRRLAFLRRVHKGRAVTRVDNKKRTFQR